MKVGERWFGVKEKYGKAAKGLICLPDAKELADVGGGGGEICDRVGYKKKRPLKRVEGVD